VTGERSGVDQRAHHPERAFLSIGEVLTLLHDEFPDVTISKIRFLESQGLIDPERTPSGYRKFYDPDVERLRSILHAQKTHFLPLKVIKDRLETGEPLSDPAPSDTTKGDTAEPPEPAAPPPRVPIWMVKSPPNASPTEDGTSVTYTFEELAAEAHMPEAELQEIKSFGLLIGRTVGATVFYDQHSLAAARAVAGFMRLGLEPRHLRLYRNAADREAGLIEQVIMPLVKQRNPDARAHAVTSMEELARLGAQLRDAVLRQNLRPYA
jgi:DNA-binding transcriptional MerR regulator